MAKKHKRSKKKSARRNPAQNVGPFRVVTDQQSSGAWEYAIFLGDEEIDTEGGWDDEDEAIRQAVSEIDDYPDVEILKSGVKPFGKPDYDTGNGQHAVWWGPAYGGDAEDAEWFTEVDGDCVTEYTFAGGYEGFEDDAWRTITTCLHPPPVSLRLRASLGVRQIEEQGGESDVLSHADVMRQFGRMLAENPRDRGR